MLMSRELKLLCGSSQSRRGFLDNLVRQVPVAMGAILLSSCARTAQTADAQDDKRIGASGPSESCVSGLKGLQLRAVEEGQPVTKDYREDRLTLVLDKQGRISRSYIG